MNENVVMTAMYMALGAERAISHTGLTPHEHLELMSSLIPYAEFACGIIEDHEDFPGVFDYEVSDPFGYWLAINYRTDDEARQKLQEMIKDFFSQEATK